MSENSVLQSDTFVHPTHVATTNIQTPRLMKPVQELSYKRMFVILKLVSIDFLRLFYLNI